MIYSQWREYRLSRLMLGTVQFGMPYGIANRTGQPDYEQVRAIIAAAAEGGVNCFDTAAAYGTSEELLGRALQELKLAEAAVVVTKVRPLTPAELENSKSASQAIKASVDESRRRLRMHCLPVVLFHREADAACLDTLMAIRDDGRLRYAGVSCDNRPGRAVAFAGDDCISALQLPANVTDSRHSRSGVFQQAASHGVAIFIRSVYLQGLLIMPEEQIPPALRDIVPVRRRLENIAVEGGMGLAELCVRYMLACEEATCVLTGVETEAQVRGNIEVIRRGPIPEDMRAAIEACVADIRDELITPSQWPPRKEQT
jgi:aryl-alcohol dehydrogenase-like predicted oxidoreductase